MPKIRNGEGKVTHRPSEKVLEVSDEKCECGSTKFTYQKVCGQCYLKNLIKKDDGKSTN